MAAADDVVDAGVEAAQHLVVDLGEVEVHPPGAVGVDLRAGDERAGEAVVDEGVEDVRVGVQLSDPRPVLGVDAHDDRVPHLGIGVEQVPDDVVDRLDGDDRYSAAGVVEPADVADLTAAAGVQRRAVEHDAPRCGVDDHGVVLVEVGMLVTEVHGHGSHGTAADRR